MTCWEILGLTPGAESREIKRRFAQLVKVNRPEDDPAVYQRLRDAYEQALSCEENLISDNDVWDDEEAVSKRVTPTRIRFPTVNISARIHHQNPIVVSTTLSWQSVLDDLFLVNESRPQQAETQLADAVARLSSSDLKSRLQFEEHLALNLSRVFRPLLTLAAAEKFKWHLTSGGNHQAACCAINDKRTLWLLIEAEIAPLFFADMSVIDEIESGDRLKRIYQNYVDDAENRPWFDAVVLMQIARYDLSSAFLGFWVEKLGWSVKTDKNIRCWSVAERFYALEIIHPLGYEKLCAAISAADGVYHTSKTLVSYAKAAEQKHAISRYNLGLLYEQGEDVEQDENRAFFWFSCAAKQGHADAQHSLGVCYREGKGTTQDFQQAIYWFMKSAVQENVYAQYDLGRIYIDEASGMQDYVKAFYWFQKAAQQGFAHAQNHLGWLYYNETTGSRNYQQALRWFTLAAEQHCDVAQYNLGKVRISGEILLG
ncbi:SEL1-like repeat protein [Klebsiella sp. RHBSTW-00484]|uniref:J domain-containing protein n=1 Tax=unclassified Klebsiella TaxID=2608929 RepID=UPI0015E5397B|nr:MULTISPECIES: J domain-containing protein [unclassified Klebsiella]QLO37389.1 SEL1-like repeat protein [Klebsiella sp. RHBSTW-00484]QLT76907.1 SEL1-like repeat protein [Klebsiella sp. RHBSTW-00464]